MTFVEDISRGEKRFSRNWGLSQTCLIFATNSRRLNHDKGSACEELHNRKFNSKSIYRSEQVSTRKEQLDFISDFLLLFHL